MARETLCLAPWYHASVHADGSLRPCLVSWDKVGQTGSGDTFHSVWNGPVYKNLRQRFLKGERPEGCKSCVYKESKGIRSRREILNEEIGRLTKKSFETLCENLQVHAEERFVTLDLSLGNQCNLRCRFCGPYNSTKWHKNLRALFEKNPEFWQPLFGRADYPITQQADSAFADLLPQSSDLQLIEIKGGEPFLLPQHIALLKHLVASGRAKDIYLVYATNGTVIQNEMLELFPQFKGIFLTVSVDGTGALYQYIRGESIRLETDVEKNLRFYDQFDNLTLNIHFTLCAYNIFGITDFLTWVNALQLKTLKKNPGWTLGIVAFPQELRVSALPLSLREQAVRRLDGLTGEHIEKIRQELAVPEENAAIQHDRVQRFLTYAKDLDATRGTELGQVVPELEPLFSFL